MFVSATGALFFSVCRDQLPKWRRRAADAMRLKVSPIDESMIHEWLADRN